MKNTIYTYAWSATEEETTLLNKIINSTLKQEFTVIKLSESIPLKHSINDILLCFGQRAFNLVKEHNAAAIELPALYQLSPSNANKSTRQQAWDILISIGKEGPADQVKEITLSNEDVLTLMQNKSGILSEAVTKNNTLYWLGTTLSNKKVLITNNNSINIHHDFSITFEELYALKTAIDILRLGSVTIRRNE